MAQDLIQRYLSSPHHSQHGASIGDSVLQSTIERLKSLACESGATLRGGTKECAISLSKLESELKSTARDALISAERIRRSLIEPMSAFSRQDDLESSGPHLVQSGISPIRYQDKTLNNIKLCLHNLLSDSADRRRLENDLHSALPSKQFEIYLQPIIDTRVGEIAGAEALLRWNHPQLGVVSPEIIIPILENTGLIIPIGAWIVEESLRLCRHLLDTGKVGESFTMCVNISPTQIADAGFVQLVIGALTRERVPASMITLEITENVVIDRHDEMATKLNELVAHGVSFSLDDFGTGYSSLSQLRNTPVGAIKIDKSFVRTAATNDCDAAIIRAITALGRDLRLEVIAEGVETIEQLEMLKRLGCSKFQGYLFSRPVPAADFEVLIDAWWSRGDA